MHEPANEQEPASFPAFAEILREPRSVTREAIAHATRRDERCAVRALLAEAKTGIFTHTETRELARRLTEAMRAERGRASGVDALMHEFSLSSEEGIALMCLAEALLRIPDRDTVDRLIADKLAHGDWQRHLGASPSPFVNAAAWGLAVTGKLVSEPDEEGLRAAAMRLLARGGEPLIRKGMDFAMRLLGRQFVAGRDIEEALERGREREVRGYRHSYDMLGEAALTADDAERYFQSYADAIHAIGIESKKRGIRNGPGISVKLSALHPRYVRAQRDRVLLELLPRLKQLVLLAKRYDIGLNIDAEEADRLELSLDLLDALAGDPDLAGFDGLGFVVQAYQKRCPFVIDHLADLARRNGRRFMVRLVKGAYWDGEIKRAQVEGLDGYPVYTRKSHTDLSYQVCAQRLLAAADVLYPQFATHNALTLAAVVTTAREMGVNDYEFQCLHGMGESLYDQIVGPDGLDIPCRIYAPVGSHETLLAYLVRRLLENGANSSFVNQLVDPAIPVDTLLHDPLALAAAADGAPHPEIPLPAALYEPERRNAAGYDLGDENCLRAVAQELSRFDRHQWHAHSLHTSDRQLPPAPLARLAKRNPARHADVVGFVHEANTQQVQEALNLAATANQWQQTSTTKRAAILCRAADLLEDNAAELIAIAMREAGKTLSNAIGELREAVDFLRYYAAAIPVDGIALGPVVCISPWNFPLSIFVGQVGAALAAGNAVLAKPAEQTPLIACRAVQLLHEAGVPRDALFFLPGPGETVGAQLVADARVRGVVFTGSTEVARQIDRTLTRRAIAEGKEIALIAETGGQNAMLVDSSALTEQVVRDAITSAFDSAGQRCSTLRVLCLQEEIADRTLEMLHGALHELQIGWPDRISTDVGPVIDHEAQQRLQAYIEQARHTGRQLAQLPLPSSCSGGSFVAPVIIEIDRIADLDGEVFGPVLHVLRYRREQLPQLIEAINATGYGLTLGVHTRIDNTVRFIAERARVGNIYVNRNMIGAVVGVQPFGGEGLSGTGPKAGGPLYLRRLQSECPATVSAALSMPDAPPPPAWTSFNQWSTRYDAALAALCRQYECDSLYGKECSLHGPTGESNVLRFIERGAVLCAANDTASLLNQLAAVLATGNVAVLASSTATLLPSDLPTEVDRIIHRVAVVNECRELALVLYDQASIAVLNEILERDGPVVPTVCTSAEMVIPLWRLVTEKTICINTAAAGGNTSLIAMSP
jgi:RHH-type proline utilization regulon transcriptional repressor/proline dehydrogenase/delta 1-pyrroline-5-carboxylate dehydrogenase